MANWCAHKGYPRLKEEEEVGGFDSGCWGYDPFLGILLDGFCRGTQAYRTEYREDADGDDSLEPCPPSKMWPGTALPESDHPKP